MIHDTHHFSTSTPLSPLTLGRYRIAACPRALPGGRFAAQVSIASGTGSACTARVMRFVDDFATHDDAFRYAEAQGLSWVAERQSAASTPLAAPQPPLAIQAILI
jgi:hypothetical protein